MGLLHRGSKDVVEELEADVKAEQRHIQQEEAGLKELFVSLKGGIIDRLLRGGRGMDREGQVRILLQHVRHVLGIARKIDDQSLIASFTKEKQVVERLLDLLQDYPDADLANHPDVREALVDVQNMLEEQRELIFGHERILLQEKQNVVAILQQVEALRNEEEQTPSVRSRRPTEFM